MNRKILIPILFILLCATLYPQSRQTAAMRTAEHMERTGDLDGAIQIYSDILEKNSRNLQVYWKLKDIYQRKGDLDGGIELIKTHLNDFPDDIQALMDLGEFHYLKNEKDVALNSWLELETRFGSSPVVYRQLFNLFARLGEETYMKALVARGRQRFSNNSFMSYDLGSYYQIRQAVEPAIEEFLLFSSSKTGQEEKISSNIIQMIHNGADANKIERTLIQFEPVYYDIVPVLLSDLYFATKRYKDAYDSGKKTGFNSTENIKRFLELANSLRSEDEYNLARAAYFDILNSMSRFKTNEIIGSALLGLGQSFEEQLINEKNIEQDQLFFNSNVIFNYPFPVHDDTLSPIIQSAFTFYDSILTDLPATHFSSNANYRLGEVQFKVTNQLDGAKRSYLAALKNRPDPKIREELMIRIGQVSIAQGHVDSAIVHFSKESKRYPKAQLFWVQALFLDGNMTRAITAVDSILVNLPPESENFNDLVEFSDFVKRFYTKASPDNRMLFNSFISAEKLISMMKPEEAAELLNFARIQIPDGTLHPWLILREAELRFRIGQVDKSLELCEILKETFLGESAWILSGKIYEQLMMDSRMAIREYTKFLEEYPGSVHFEPVRRHLRSLNN